MSSGLRHIIWAAALLVGIVGSAAQADAPPAEKVGVSIDSKRPLPTAPGYYELPCNLTIGARQIPSMFGLFLPPAYFKGKERFPVVVALHNVGANNWLTGEGMGLLWVSDRWDSRDPTSRPANRVSLKKDGQFVGIAPSCPNGIGFDHPAMPQIIAELVGQVAGAYRVDEDRIYLTGFSYGGTCTWLIAERMPEYFAAIVPLSTRATADPAKTVERLRGVPVYLVSGENEWAVPFVAQMADALKKGNHPDFVYRKVTNGSHWCYPAIYGDPKFWEWLLAKKRKHPATSAPTSKP